MSETDFRLLPEGLKRHVRDRKALMATAKISTFSVPQGNTSRTISTAAPRSPAAVQRMNRSPVQGLPVPRSHPQWAMLAHSKDRGNLQGNRLEAVKG